MRQLLAGAALFGAMVLPAAAQAGEVVFTPQNNPPNSNDGWQAGTCNTPTCAPDSPAPEFFETAAGHPPFGITQFIVKNQPFVLNEVPDVNMKTLRVDLPVGLSVNPGATPQCAEEHPKDCPVSTRVGESIVTVSIEGAPLVPVPVTAQVYNLKPKFGQPARFGFTVEAIPGIPVIPPSDIYLEADVAYESDFHEGFTINVPKVQFVKLLKNRLIFNGRAHADPGIGYFLSAPSTCLDPNQGAFQHTYSTYARADSIENTDPSFPSGSPFVEAKLPPGTSPKGCASIPFKPTVAVDPGTSQVDSPAGATTELKLPVEAGATEQETSTMRTARVTLPPGLGINPSAADGLAACSDAQFGKGTRNPVACPAASKIGTVAVVTPPLPEGPLIGNVYVGEQKSRNPESGDEYRIFVAAESARYGISVRLVGNVVANAKTGQLTAVFDEAAKTNVLRGGNADNLPSGLPQVPLTSFKLSIDGGPKAALSSPPTCGPNTTTSQLTPWSGNPAAAPSSNFNLASLPGGGACPKTMAVRPFAPGFSAKPKTDAAKTFTPFSADITRPQGQQELKGLDLVLPEGATAKLKGVPYCSPEEIEKTETRSGAAEKKKSTCPKESKVGDAIVQAGTGPSPLKIDGDAYLAGRYRGAPLSIVVVTPALAGPFDLGNVVVRVPFFLDPETAQIHPKVNDLPDVYGGTKLDVRSVFLNVNRDEFTLNGTNCRKGVTAGAINGGGANPLDPGAYSAFNVADGFQATGCKPLKFRPSLKVKLFGKTQRAKHPKLRAVLKMPGTKKVRGKKGRRKRIRVSEANIRKASVALPHALFLDQASLAKVCTRVQFAAENCPKKSIYGKARAFTPLLGKPLEGPVYLRSSNNTLPDMVAHLEGQVDIDLVGRIDSFKGGIRTTFGRVPDVPVTKFILTLPGGKKGLLVNSTNLCAKPVKAIIRLKAQNGRKANRRSNLDIKTCHNRKR